MKSPEGQELKSRNELRKYLEETNSTHSYADLAFLFKGGEKKSTNKKKRTVQKSIHPAKDGVWSREAVQRKSGVNAGQFDVYFYRYNIQFFIIISTNNSYILFKVLKGKSSDHLLR